MKSNYNDTMNHFDTNVPPIHTTKLHLCDHWDPVVSSSGFKTKYKPLTLTLTYLGRANNHK